MLARSYLFVPADRPERFAKALASGADAVVVDLEDAVAPQVKTEARSVLNAWLQTATSQIVVRVNAAGSNGFSEDVRLCAHPAVVAVMLPKAERADDLAELVAALPGKRLIPLVETAVGIANARELAATTGVERLAFGSIDFKVDVGIEGDSDDALLTFRSMLVLASRLGGCAAPIDGVTPSIDDERLVASQTDYARRLGFGAKLCIHPRQVPIVNHAFTPAPASIAWAQRVLDAVRDPSKGAVAVDGKMVDRPVVLQAQRILAQAGLAEGDARAD